MLMQCMSLAINSEQLGAGKGGTLAALKGPKSTRLLSHKTNKQKLLRLLSSSPVPHFIAGSPSIPRLSSSYCVGDCHPHFTDG